MLEVFPLSLNFPDQKVGTTSGALAATLSNSGNAPLHVTGVTISGDFAQTDDCSTVAIGDSCSANVTFTPTQTGLRTGTLSFADDAGTQNVSLSGNGTAPVVNLSTTNVQFPTTLINTSSAPQNVTLTNTGNATLVISNIIIDVGNVGDFSQTNTCPAVLNPGANCTISVTFKPTVKGFRFAEIHIFDDAANSPQKIGLTGTGTVVRLLPKNLNFGNVQVGSSLQKTVTMQNVGAASMSISGFSITGANAADYSQTNNCGTSLAGHASCTITVTFTPAATGTRLANLSITDNGGGSPQKVSLTGTGT